jgi:flavin reductase (DIM6/NTAB) family NADH-FMN oxidoreductase RutF
VHSYRPREGHRLAHDPLNSIIAPRPIGWVSTVSTDGTRNLAPYSFFNLLNYRPPIVGFSSTGHKDSVTNAEATGQFVWNLATRTLAGPMNQTSAAVGPEVDEFTLAGLTPHPSTLVHPPRVAESPVAFECQVTRIQELTDVDEQGVGAWLVLGEVVQVHIDDSLVADGVFDTLAADPLLRGGGPADYFTLSQERRLRMTRPDAR